VVITKSVLPELRLKKEKYNYMLIKQIRNKRKKKKHISLFILKYSYLRLLYGRGFE
jgi:hypothetical protein